MRPQTISGENLSVDEPLAAIKGEGLARNLGVRIGDKVVLLANTATGGTNAGGVNVLRFFFDSHQSPRRRRSTRVQCDGTHITAH